LTKDESFLLKHIELIKKVKYVNRDLIREANFKIVVDAVNSVGGICVPALLRELGVSKIIELNCEPTGIFAHKPEPLPENLMQISRSVVENKADLGIVVDPDVDRLAIVNQDGSMFGEEYTLVAVADLVLSENPGNTVSNLSSTRALSDITEKFGKKYFASAVGEVNVVECMKENYAIIGGEGNGGVILPELHYGRDALVGIALFLTNLAKSKLKCSEFRKKFPEYHISKNRVDLTENTDIKLILNNICQKFKSQKDVKINTADGVKLDFPDAWVHIRASNTEPILRIYSESSTETEAQKYASKIIDEILLMC